MNERVWVENEDTAKGRAEHEKVHSQRIERRGKSIKLYEYAVFSDELGLQGFCDCIEAEMDEAGCMIPAAEFPVRLYPVEFKHGNVRSEREYEIQLCAEAMCLEEMYGTRIPEGALFFVTAHKRFVVSFTNELRALVRSTAAALHHIRETLSVPTAEFSRRCVRCSLLEICGPQKQRSARNYCQCLEKEAKEKNEG